jgi:hypothetical protein
MPYSVPISSTQQSLLGRTEEMLFSVGGDSSTGQGIIIGVLTSLGTAGVALVVLAIFFFLKYTRRGRILLDRIGRPGEFDDEQAFAREEAEALETMDDLSRTEYLRAKGPYGVIRA